MMQNLVFIQGKPVLSATQLVCFQVAKEKSLALYLVLDAFKPLPSTGITQWIQIICTGAF